MADALRAVGRPAGIAPKGCLRPVPGLASNRQAIDDLSHAFNVTDHFSRSFHLLVACYAAGKPHRAVLIFHANAVFLHSAAIAQRRGDLLGGLFVFAVFGTHKGGCQNGEGECRPCKKIRRMSPS